MRQLRSLVAKVPSGRVIFAAGIAPRRVGAVATSTAVQGCLTTGDIYKGGNYVDMFVDTACNGGNEPIDTTACLNVVKHNGGGAISCGGAPYGSLTLTAHCQGSGSTKYRYDGTGHETIFRASDGVKWGYPWATSQVGPLC